MSRLVEPVVGPGSIKSHPQPVLMDAGLVLRPWDAQHAGAVVSAYADREIQRWNLQRMDDTADALAWIQSWSLRWAAETDACWAVTDGSQVLGRIALRGIDLDDGVAECTYWTVPAARGHGVAPRAVEVVSGWAMGLGLHRLELQHSTGNPASCRVAVKAGFRAEGTRSSAQLHSDGWHDMHAHARVSQSGAAVAGHHSARQGGAPRLVVRRAVPADIALLEDLKWSWAQERGEAVGREVHLGRLTAWIERCWESHVPYVATRDGAVLGVAWLALSERVPGGDGVRRAVGDVQSVYVSPGFRSGGVGSALVTAILEDAAALALEFLTVRPGQRSRPFYERLGFENQGGLLTALLHQV